MSKPREETCTWCASGLGCHYHSMKDLAAINTKLEKRVAELEAQLDALSLPKVPQPTEVREMTKRIQELERALERPLTVIRRTTALINRFERAFSDDSDSANNEHTNGYFPLAFDDSAVEFLGHARTDIERLVKALKKAIEQRDTAVYEDYWGNEEPVIAQFDAEIAAILSGE